MSNNGKLKKLTFEADESLTDALQACRSAGKQYNGKKFSNRLAYEIGVKVLMGINEEEEEEALKQKLTDLETKENLIANQKKFILAGIEKLQAKKQKKEGERLKLEQDVQNLADRLRKDWVTIKVLKKTENIGFIVNSYPNKLTKSKLEKIFSEGSTEGPTLEEAMDIAANLLGVGIND